MYRMTQPMSTKMHAQTYILMGIVRLVNLRLQRKGREMKLRALFSVFKESKEFMKTHTHSKIYLL